MARAQIVRAWREGGRAYLAVRIREPGQGVDTEYIGSVPLEDLRGKPATQQKAALVEAVKAERQRVVDSVRGDAADLPGLSGAVDL